MYLFLYYKHWVSTDLAAFTQIFVGTMFIGIFPIVLSGLMIQMKAYRRNTEQAENLQDAINNPLKYLEIIGKNIQTFK